MDVSLTPTGRFNEDGPFEMPNGTQFFVEWTHGSHSGEDVPVSAMGPWSELLVGVYENTHIYQVMYLALTGGE
jgi:alkaline phosphatase